MGLGELHIPRGLALETARAVLEVDPPMACNVAIGCSNECKYCYGTRSFKKKDWGNMRYPKTPPVDLIRAQVKKGISPLGIFLSFGTDPLVGRNRIATSQIVKYAHDLRIRVAVLTKVGGPSIVRGSRYGITMVSVDERFRKKFEPNAHDLQARLRDQKWSSDQGEYTWISMEPYPVPEIFKQDLEEVLEAVSHAKFIIFGKWNYDRRASTSRARDFYKDIVPRFRDFCKSRGIRYHVKSDTLKFIGED